MKERRRQEIHGFVHLHRRQYRKTQKSRRIPGGGEHRLQLSMVARQSFGDQKEDVSEFRRLRHVFVLFREQIVLRFEEKSLKHRESSQRKVDSADQIDPELHEDLVDSDEDRVSKQSLSRGSRREIHIQKLRFIRVSATTSGISQKLTIGGWAIRLLRERFLSDGTAADRSRFGIVAVQARHHRV